MDPFSDERFKHIVKDPRFRNAPVRQQKFKIDKRFQSMFTDNKFKLNYKVDIRGRPIHQTSGEDLKRFYDVEDDEEESDGQGDDEQEEDEDASVEGDDELEEVQEPSSSGIIKLDVSEGEVAEANEESRQRKLSEPEDVKSISSEKRRDQKGVEKGEDREKANVPKTNRDLEAEKLQDEIVQNAMTDKIKDRLHDMSVDYARGAGVIDSESSSDEPSSSEDEEVSHPWGELDADAAEATQETNRLAICHMDWDRVTAKDIMVLIHSFLPPTSMICSVTIYPSEFGIQRMKEEELKGPRELTDEVIEYESEDDDKEDDGDNIPWSRMEKLREYQLNRLKYYYAVAEFDTVESASKFYSECDRMEYESSATHLDLRFIPDDMTFDQEPKESCDKLPDLTKYQPRLFCNTALQQGRVNLTWEEPDPDRVDLTKKLAAGVEVDELAIKSFVAMSSEEENDQAEESKEDSSSSDFSEGDEKPNRTEKVKSKDKKNEILKYRSLLNELQVKKESKKGDVEMEITWDLGLQRRTEELKEKEKMEKLTPFEKMMAKRREKKKDGHKQKKDDLFSDDELPPDVDLDTSYHKEELAGFNKKGNKKKGKRFDAQSIDEDEEKRKADLALLIADDEDEGKSHFSLKKIQQREAKENKKTKWKKKDDTAPEEDNFQIDLKDERFNALFTSHHYHIDPTAAQFRKTKASEQIIAEKQKRRKMEDESGGMNKKKVSEMPLNPDINKLVANVKKNTNKKSN